MPMVLPRYSRGESVEIFSYIPEENRQLCGQQELRLRLTPFVLFALIVFTGRNVQDARDIHNILREW